MVRQGIIHLLHSAGITVVGESGSAVDAIQRIPSLHPDVVILDGRLPDGSGIDVCREIRSIDSSIRSVVLTAYSDDEAILAAILAGANGYLLKEIGSDDFADKVRRVAAGENLFSPEMRDRVVARLQAAEDSDPRLANLTSQEKRVLSLVAEGLTNRQIAQHLFLAEKTVRNYVSILLAKLGFERRTQAAIFISRGSVRFRDDPDWLR
ncbi:MAG: response regulator transcription factor [Glaciihabitans sp.]|nr:response regulator transcription factor [Glaciihabitans sp.]